MAQGGTSAGWRVPASAPPWKPGPGQTEDRARLARYAEALAFYE